MLNQPPLLWLAPPELELCTEAAADSSLAGLAFGSFWDLGFVTFLSTSRRKVSKDYYCYGVLNLVCFVLFWHWINSTGSKTTLDCKLQPALANLRFESQDSSELEESVEMIAFENDRFSALFGHIARKSERKLLGEIAMAKPYHFIH